MNYILDKQFLKKLDYQKEKEIYIKIISLNNDNSPKEELTGKCTGGSVNVDGSSAVRRTCSLSLIVNENDKIINDKNWCYNTEFKLEIGIKNFIEPKYPDIIWFNMGHYVIASFNYSQSTTGISVSISGKDKMCRLNGEIGGHIAMTTDFGTIEETNKDSDNNYYTVVTKLSLYDIIKNAIKEYGQEEYGNIIINDLEANGYELWEYRGSSPMYLIAKRKENTTGYIESFYQITFNGNTKVKKIQNNKYVPICDLPQYYSTNTLDPNYNEGATEIEYNRTPCYVIKVEYGQTAGYHQIPLVYNSDLILNAGETVTSLLDKIKNMLGNYEYFYNLDGQFVFQKKKTYIQELFSPISGDIYNPIVYDTQYEYKFEDKELFTSIANNPNIIDLKNDFTVWGTKSGTNVPIHARYAIHKKPTEYITPWGEDRPNSNSNTYTYSSSDWDWRELIYQMAIDYYKHGQKNDFFLQIANLNPNFKNGKTGYEQYYSDMQAFWRQLYNPLKTDNDLYTQELGGYEYYDSNSGDKKYWNKDIHIDPTRFNFWIDFLDVGGELNDYSVNNIGSRTKVVNESQIKSIYNRETPEILFKLPTDGSITNQNNFTVVNIQANQSELFGKSAQGLSTVSKINELVYQHTAVAESISITSIPIFYLQPNKRIYIEGYGDYTLDKISYSLNYNSTMNINGNKIIKQFN